MACTSSLTLGGSRLRRQLFPCIACTRVHWSIWKIGKVLGEDNDYAVRRSPRIPRSGEMTFVLTIALVAIGVCLL